MVADRGQFAMNKNKLLIIITSLIIIVGVITFNIIKTSKNNIETSSIVGNNELKVESIENKVIDDDKLKESETNNIISNEAVTNQMKQLAMKIQ